MKVFLKALIFCIFFSSTVKANAFSEVFGSEGAAGIGNSKMRSISYTFQYFTLIGSLGYVAKQLYNSGFMEPLGLMPESIHNLSPLAYKDDFLINKYNASAYAVGEKMESLNMLNDYKIKIEKNPFSMRSIESRNNFNFKKSSFLNDERNELINRYLND
ncbi:MAG: hypothetical protein CMP38_02170 [Rickettsiales bacterium]|nr:hypothetical protein [Rickettsiales bacterium]|tara:strand:+ start:349 stop:825 length:477 start_codon:yes stop_codon:yes gene_type:complete